MSPEARDLPQARLAIEALRALEPVLKEGGVDEAVVRDLEQARLNLQLAYAKADRGGRRGLEAEIGVFGGSGFYELLDDVEEVAVETPVRTAVRRRR